MPASSTRADGTHESQITLVKHSPPLAPAPRFAACLGAPGGWLCVRLIRCTNAAPIAHDGQVSQVVAAQCVCTVASQLGSTARSGVVRGDSSGGAEWDETLRLPLPLGSIALDVELRLSVRDAAQRSQCAPMALLPRTGTATVPLRGASGRCWCAVRGSGPPRSDGEPAGSAELLLEYWRLQPEPAEAAAGAAAEAAPWAGEAGGGAAAAEEAGPGSSEGGGADPGGPVPVGRPNSAAEWAAAAAECGGGKPRPVVLLDDRGNPKPKPKPKPSPNLNPNPNLDPSPHPHPKPHPEQASSCRGSSWRRTGAWRRSTRCAAPRSSARGPRRRPCR